MVALAACTELAPGGDRLPQAVERNAPDAGPAGDPRWSCLDAPEPARAVPLVRAVELTLGVADSVTERPPEGLVARACQRLDVMCNTPLTSDMTVQADGALHLSVPQEFDGFIELRSPTTVPTMFYINRPLMRDTQDAIVIVSTLALGGLAATGNVTLDPTLGNVLIRVFDCQGAPASGVELANDLGGEVFAFVGGLPRVGESVTRADGVGGFVNVPPDFAVLQGIVAASGREVGTESVTVRAGWFSYGDVAPATN
ncbi:MAG TPA: hypothetical protein VMG12_07655 [Polyangiaceae bacterium]|nr:hypothetical protein [Polyangiaceae bacterium]